MLRQTAFVKRLVLCVLTGFAVLLIAKPLAAQLPFYTDDPAVTPTGVLHLESIHQKLMFLMVVGVGKISIGYP